MFVEIPGYQGYLVNDAGDVVSLRRNRWKVKCFKTNRRGYKLVTLRANNSASMKLVHRLVMLAFVGPSELQVNHKDGNKANNNLSNLEYCTATENIRHAVDTGLKVGQQGERHSQAKLSDAQASEILLLKGLKKQSEVALQFGVSRSTVCYIWSGKIRKHLRPDDFEFSPPGIACGEHSSFSKISESQARHILSLKGQMTQAETARLVGVSRGIVGNIWRGESWSHIHGRECVS
jgi:predicted XRE-type DNA-binding protein